LLQKTQPLFALALAPLFLGERRRPFFWPIAIVALIGAYLLALGWVSPIAALHGANIKAALFAIAASALWGAGTVAGRLLSKALPPLTIAAGRFSLALPLLTLALIIHPAHMLTVRHINFTLALDWLAIALIPDILGMTVYYFGMRNTTASIATLAELAYPATALLAGFVLLHQRLNIAQCIGLIILVIAVEQLAVRKAVKEPKPDTVPLVEPIQV
jgi:drug/metabolite transporter (DMT)-like permease